MMHYYGGYSVWNGFGILHFIIPIIFWILVIGLIITFFKHGSWSDKEEGQYLEIAKKRYAEGEISKKEYLELKKEFS